MRYAICALTLLICVPAAAGVAYLHGYDRALGREEWRFEARFVEAYAGEIPLHAGPLGLLALASVLSTRSSRSLRGVLVAAAVAAALALYETREAERAYILAQPGGFASPPSWCNVLVGALWLGGSGVLGWALFGAQKGNNTSG